jgi:hypothetical protein
MLSRNHIKLHMCLEHPHYLNKPITLPTHPKQQTSQKQKKALTAMIMMTGHSGKQSAKEVRKERPRTTKVPTMKRNKPEETNNHPPQNDH